MSTTSDSSWTVFSSVFSALYAGITTAIFFPLIMVNSSILFREFPSTAFCLMRGSCWLRWHGIGSNCSRLGIDVYRPDMPVGIVVHQLQIIGYVHIPCPYDFG